MKNLFGVTSSEEERELIKHNGELPMDDHDQMIAAFIEYCYWNEKFDRFHTKKLASYSKRLLLEIERLIKVRRHNITAQMSPAIVHRCPECGITSKHRNFELWHEDGVCTFNGTIQKDTSQRK